MKKTILAIAILCATICASAQEKTSQNAYKREGNTFVQSDKEKTFKGDEITAYKWRDSSGQEYPIILHTYAKGEKAGRTTAYVIRVSGKTGKEYKYFLPDGEAIAKEIMNEKR